MKKTLLTSLLGMAITGAVIAQTDCPHDTFYYYRFIDGSTTKTPISRTIYFGPEVDGGDGATRSSISQTFRNGDYVNNSKNEFVLHQPSGNFSELLYSKWDSVAAAWKPLYKLIQTFGANNLVTESVELEANQAGVLENVSKTTKTFNAKNRQTNITDLEWVSGAWRNKRQSNFNYQTDTLLTLGLSQTWDVAGNVWVNDGKTERTFDTAGGETSFAEFIWDANSSAWKGNYMQVNTFNQQGFQTALEELIWDMGTSSFLKSSRRLYTPNADGKSTVDSVQYWNSGVGAYVSSAVLLYSYNTSNQLLTYRQLTINASGVVTANYFSTRTLDAGNRPLEIFEQDSSSAGGGVWRPFRRWTYTYNANGDKLTEKYVLRQGTADTLSNANRSTFTYNANNLLLTSFSESWNATASAWVPNDGSLNEYNNDGKRIASEYKSVWNATGNYFNSHNRTEYVCKSPTVGINEVMQNGFKVYPNPIASGSSLNIETFDAGNYQMLDFNGRTVKSGAVNAGVNSISSSDLSAGFYLLKLNNNTLKVVIQ